MILGTGVDLAEVRRIREAVERYGERFVNRIFTDAEIAYVERKANKYERYAGRFAAKEAGMKAIGTGKSAGVLWRDIEVVRGRGGPPQLEFHGAARRHFDRLGATKALITITHTAQLAIVHVMLVAE